MQLDFIIQTSLTETSSFTTIDTVLGLFLIGALVKGFFNGFIKEIAALLAWIVGLYGAVHFSYFLIDFLKENLEWTEQNLNLLAFILTFLIIFVVFKLLAKILTKLSSYMALGIINRIAGGIFGLLKSALVLGVVLVFFASFNKNGKWVSQETVEASILYQPVKNFGAKVLPSVVNKIKEHSSFDFELPILDTKEGE